MLLSKTPLFQSIEESEIQSLLQCLTAAKRSYRRGEVILSEGTKTENLGLVLSGMAIISYCDAWGNCTILGHIAPGSVFAETYACIPGEPLRVTVSAAEDTQVLFIGVGRILSTCSSACPFHAQLIRNLLSICAHKNLQLSQKILHTGSKSIRGRLMAYFSECAARCGNHCFEIPYNRQQLADYLNVDRSALCNELSKMQRDGILRYDKNHFCLNGRQEFPQQ